MFLFQDSRHRLRICNKSRKLHENFPPAICRYLVSIHWRLYNTQVVYIYMSNLTLAENKIAETKFVFKMRIVSKLVNKSWKLQENFPPAICHYSSKNSTFKIRNVEYWNNKRLIKIEERIFLFKIRIVGLEFCWYMKVCFNLNYFY